MTNPKIERVKSDIEKTKAKISVHQAKLRDLEREKTRLENEQIIALVRGEKISDAELSTLMKSIRKEDTTDALADATAAAIESTQQEETQYASINKN